MVTITSTISGRKFGRIARLCALAAIAAIANDASAAVISWNGSNANWTNSGSWSGVTTPPTNDLVTDIAQFNSGSYTNQPTVDAARSINGLIVGTSSAAVTIGGTFSLSLGSSGIDMSGSTGGNLAINNAGTTGGLYVMGNQTWAVGGSRTLTLNNNVVFGGVGTITKTGTGTLTLSNTDSTRNRFFGVLDIQGGTVNAGAAASTVNMSAINLAAGATYATAGNGRSGSLSGAGTVTTTSGGYTFYGLGDATFSGVFGVSGWGGGVSYRGQGIQTFDGTRVLLTSGTTQLAMSWMNGFTFSGTWSNATANQFSGASPLLNGGTLTLDNTIAPASQRTDGKLIGINGGGTFRVVGNATANTATTIQGINFGDTGGVSNNTTGGHVRIIVNNGGASVENVLTITNGISYIPNNNSRGATLDFVGTGGTLGASGNNPRILLGAINAGNLATNLQNGVLKDPTTTAYGFAIANGSDFATYDVTNGVQALSSYTAYGSASSTQNAILSANDSNGGRTVNTLKINASGTLTGTGSMVTGAVLLAGTNSSYTISSGGGINNGSNPLYFHVPAAGATLTVTTAAGSGTGAITKSGDGTLILSGGTNGTTGRITINGGTLELPNLTGAGGFNASNSFIMMNGGVLQLTGGGSRSFAIGSPTTAGAINVEWNGGFAARSGDLNLSFTSTMTWNQGAGTGHVLGGSFLVFNSETADSMINVTSNISLGGGKNQRYFYVKDNPNSSTDRARISGVVSEAGGAVNEFVKLGPGVLELTAANTYTGGTIINEGELRVGNTVAVSTNGPLGNSASFVVVGGYNGSLNAQLSVMDDASAGAYSFARDISTVSGSAGTATIAALDTNATTNFTGTMTFNRTATLSAVAGGTADFSGLILGGGGVIKSDAGTVRLSRSAGNIYTGGTTVSAGTLLIANSTGSATGTGAVVVNGGKLAGTGRITGNVTINAGGTYAPGTSIGTIDHGSANLTLAGTSEFEISRTAGPVYTNDLANNIGALSYGGVLKILLDGGSQSISSFAIGDSWDLFNFASQSGTFSNNAVFGTVGDGTNLPTLNAGLNWSFNYGTGVLSVVAGAAGPANLTITPGSGSRSHGQTVVINATPDNGTYTVGSTAVSGYGWSQSGISNGSLSGTNNDLTGTVSHNTTNSINGDNQGRFGFAISGASNATANTTYGYTLTNTVAGNVAPYGAVDAFGTTQKATILNGNTVAGYSVNGTRNTGLNQLGSTFTIQASEALTADTDLEMSIRRRVDGGANDEVTAGDANFARFQNSNGKLFSDVVNINGIDGKLYVLTISYNEADLGGQVEDALRLGWLNENTNKWLIAVLGNTGGAYQDLGVSSWTTIGTLDAGDLGKFGVDTTNNYVWAVLNHNSQFAVIPEPTSLALLGLGAAALLARRRK